MSGSPSCASTEPSLKATRLCTTDCGWTRTSIRSSGMAKRWWASISSRPLFIIVALSTLILAPIDQFGWRTASAGVTPAIRSRLAVRNGPPEAVSRRRSIAERIAAGQGLEDRVVLGIDRQQGGAVAGDLAR